MSELRKTVPTLVPEPIAWGKCHLAYPPTYFFLIEFVNVSDRLPDPAKLGAAIAELHRTSVSPNGKFGFHIQTYDGKLPHNTEWNDSWPDFFVKFLTSVYDQDVKTNGVWKEMESIFERAMKFVVPRLLGALEADGRKIKPCLIHADLWEGNIGTEYETGRIIIFDSCGFYAHNELELGQWRCNHRHLRAKAYKKEYLRHFAASEPVAEWDDRNRLYSLNEQIMYSAHVPGTDVRHQ
jgi:protein-ribulosamine 3-kinase